MNFTEKYKEWRENYNYKRGRLDCRNFARTIKQSLSENWQMYKLEGITGYDSNELKSHLIKTIPEGYTWKDFVSGWLQIDHIVPKRAFVFDSPEDYEFKQCWSLCNLRLIKAEENQTKYCTIENPILLGLLISNCGKV